jgi:hypothetical protein
MFTTPEQGCSPANATVPSTFAPGNHTTGAGNYIVFDIINAILVYIFRPFDEMA